MYNRPTVCCPWRGGFYCLLGKRPFLSFCLRQHFQYLFMFVVTSTLPLDQPEVFHSTISWDNPWSQLPTIFPLDARLSLLSRIEYSIPTAC